MNKTYVVLKMYDEVKKGNLIKLEEYCVEYKISISTFRRYVNMLRSYFWEEYERSLVFSRMQGGYHLIKNDSKESK